MAQANQLTGYALMFVITGIMLGVGLYVVNTMQSTLGASSTAQMNSAFANTTIGLGTLAGWLPIIAIVVAAAIILFLVVNSFGGKKA